MKKIVSITLLFIFFLISQSMADTYYAQQNISYRVLAVNEIWVSSDPSPLVISTAEAGQPPDEAVDNSTTYFVVTNEGMYSNPEKTKKITGKINQSMPSHTYLKTNLSAPEDAESMGDVELNTDSKDLVLGILRPGDDLTITYKFGASAEAGTLSETRTVTFTLTDET